MQIVRIHSHFNVVLLEAVVGSIISSDFSDRYSQGRQIRQEVCHRPHGRGPAHALHPHRHGQRPSEAQGLLSDVWVYPVDYSHETRRRLSDRAGFFDRERVSFQA